MKKENHLQACLRKGYVSSQTGMFIERWVQTHHFLPCFRLHVFFASASVSFSCPVSQNKHNVHSTRKDSSSPRASPGCIGMFINSTPEPPKGVESEGAQTLKSRWIFQMLWLQDSKFFQKKHQCCKILKWVFFAVFCSWKRIWQVSKLRKTQQGSDSHIYDSYPSDRPSAPRHT